MRRRRGCEAAIALTLALVLAASLALAGCTRAGDAGELREGEALPSRAATGARAAVGAEAESEDVPGTSMPQAQPDRRQTEAGSEDVPGTSTQQAQSDRRQAETWSEDVPRASTAQAQSDRRQAEAGSEEAPRASTAQAQLDRWQAEAGSEDVPRVVCASFPCFDFARAVAGGAVELTLLIRPGTEPHAFEPTPLDVRSVAECDLFVCIGGESDAWVDDVLSSFGEDAPETLRLIDCVEAIEEEQIEGMTLRPEPGEADELAYDEHIWTSPVNAMRMVCAVRDALCALFPALAEAFEENASVYLDEIADIDAQLWELVRGARRRELVFGDRFPFLYFARQYGLTCWAAFPSCSAESEPSARTLAFLIEKVRAEGIPVVYQIELSPGRTARAIAEETGAKVLTLQSVQNVSAADFAAGASYVSLMRENIEALREGLN